MILNDIYQGSTLAKSLAEKLATPKARIHVDGMTGSLPAVAAAATATLMPRTSHLLVAPSKEDAFYLCNDLETLLPPEQGIRVMLFPTSYRKAYRYADEETDNANVLMRSEVVSQLSAGLPTMVVSYPDALSEKVVGRGTLQRHTLRVKCGEQRDMWQLVERLQELGFEREDFVVEPGQYAVRGGIVDIYSYAAEQPFRIEFFDDTVDSLRSYNAATQLSVGQLEQVDIVPDFKALDSDSHTLPARVSLLDYFSDGDTVWCQSLMLALQRLDSLMDETRSAYAARLADTAHPIAGTLPKPEELACSATEFLGRLLDLKIVEYGNSHYFSSTSKATTTDIATHSEPQPVFNKRFDLLADNLRDHADSGYRIVVTVAGENQQHRLEKALGAAQLSLDPSILSFQPFQLSHGFVDHDEHLLCYTDHEIFERYHKYTVHNLADTHEAMTLKELFELKPGDYVTHIDYGVGRFSGLEKITQNGKSQELIRLIYKNNDVLYISIHGLHKISRYVGREGEAPQLNRLGSTTWQVMKAKTKRQVKDIAKDLIALYAKRKASHGFAFGPDSTLQTELEASFAYEDTPDQLKATVAVKHDMEEQAPMDRLVCGDVGFGKTEVAIRAAFKACCDSKQVAVLVPSTVLAFQHFNTFSQRLKGMPVRVDYLNRFRTANEKKQIYQDVENGKIDILIGTHAITNKDLHFKDLGLLIIDEEQKFGVSVKEKLKQMKVGVDCLTLTATPIPRTLQFSLMGARDLSIIQTPPPNRQPIETELSDFSEELIRDAISFEMSRGGQTFFISNRVENLQEMAGLVQRLVPDAHVAIAHGRMDGKEAEDTLMHFLEGDIDVLVATSIVENGLDIPNANTMIINNAHQFGLSDLHQMRGRVGRSNRKAFCYLLIPSHLTLTDEAQRRLRAIEEFSSIGSGFNIAMRDLDIRGAGNILGAEQSGFISEVGYDMYHKILNEALEELWDDVRNGRLKLDDANSSSPHSFANSQFPILNSQFTKDCSIDTDLEALIPDDYVTSISERLLLYKELGDIGTDLHLASTPADTDSPALPPELQAYRDRLEDRFGPVPQATDDLIHTVILRCMARDFGIEKLILKQDRMVCHFVANQQSPFYQSSHFTQLIQYVQNNPRRASLKESPDRLSLSVTNVKSVDAAIAQMTLLSA